MSWLLVVVLKNAILALPLAALALLVGRWWRRPALAHVLWATVLVKLLTPPVVDVPVGWKLEVEAWLGASEDAIAKGSADRPAVGQSRDAAPSRADGGVRRRGASAAAEASGHRSKRIRQTADTPFSSPPPAGPWSAPRPWFASVAAWVPSVTWIQLAGIVWLMGSLVVLGVLARRACRFRRFLRLAVQRDECLGVRVAELAHSVGMRVPPRVIVVDGIVSPMLWGLGESARLIFPSQLAKRLSPAKLDTLLLHELAHFERKDHWLRALELAAWVLLWWHPLVWFARREIERTEEECCDAWVVEHQAGMRHSYAEALLTTVDFLCEHRAALPPAACGLGEVALLRARLTQIVCGETATRLSRWVHRLVLGAGLLLAPLEPALWATSSAKSSFVAPKSASPSAKALAGTSAHGASEGPWTEGASATDDAVVPTTSPGPSSPSSLLPPSASNPRPADVLWAAAVSPNGKFRLEAKTGGKAKLIRAGSEPVDLSAHQITCVSFAPDSRTFATGHEDAAVWLWDSATGVRLYSLKGSDAAITSVQISPDGRSVAAGSFDGGVLIWDQATGDEVARLLRQGAPVSCLRWSKAGDRLAIALGAWSQRDEAALLIWTPQKRTTRLTLESPVGALDWLNGDETVLLAGWDGRCQAWSVEVRKATGQLTVDKDRVSAAAWSADCPLVLEGDRGAVYHWGPIMHRLSVAPFVGLAVLGLTALAASLGNRTIGQQPSRPAPSGPAGKPASKDASEKDATKRDASDKDASNKDASNKDASNKDASKETTSEVHKQQIEAALRVTQSESVKYEFQLEDSDARPKLLKDPILRWSNPAAGEIHGNVYLWTVNDRPAVVGSLYKWFSPHTHMSHEFHSLTEVPLKGRYGDRQAWATRGGGLKFAPLEGAPKPAAAAPQRLLQMRRLAKDFSTTKKDREGGQQELRLLPQPIYRYAATKEDVLDGGMFTFVQGTDPELFLLLEARGKADAARWMFAAARMNSVAFRLRYQDREVWTVEIMPWRDVGSHAEPYTTFIHKQP